MATSEKKTVKEIVEGNAVVFFLGALAAGFAAGFAFYQVVAKLANWPHDQEHVETAPNIGLEEYKRLAADVKSLTDERNGLQAEVRQLKERVQDATAREHLREIIIDSLVRLQALLDNASAEINKAVPVNPKLIPYGLAFYSVDHPMLCTLKFTASGIWNPYEGRQSQLSLVKNTLRIDLRRVHATLDGKRVAFTSVDQDAVYYLGVEDDKYSTVVGVQHVLPDGPRHSKDIYFYSDDTAKGVFAEISNITNDCLKYLPQNP